MANNIDEAALTLSEFIESLTNVNGEVRDAQAGFSMTAKVITMGMPVELDVAVTPSGAIALGATPPMYYLETSVMPVFHQLTLTLERIDEE